MYDPDVNKPSLSHTTFAKATADGDKDVNGDDDRDNGKCDDSYDRPLKLKVYSGGSAVKISWAS